MESMASKLSSTYVQAFSKILTFFESHNATITYQRLDNETTAQLEKFIKDKHITIQYVPPHTYRANKAERAIRSAKNHIISSFATTHPDFPLDLWDELLEQTDMTLNIMRPYTLDPSKSAYHGLHQTNYDFLAHPIAPVGILVVIHEKPAQRTSCGPHGVKGFYLGPALQHYRSFRTLVIKTQSDSQRPSYIDQHPYHSDSTTSRSFESSSMALITSENCTTNSSDTSTTCPRFCLRCSTETSFSSSPKP
jgi:hypothetical protein